MHAHDRLGLGTRGEERVPVVPVHAGQAQVRRDLREADRVHTAIGVPPDLRGRQFREDNGPLAHQVQPDSFVEINNFYTATIYEKGAEVIGMLKRLVGDAAYARALDLYFERHDGDAATIEDGYVYIRGRIKDVIVLSTGENVNPAPVEVAMLGDPRVDQVCRVGNRRSS